MRKYVVAAVLLGAAALISCTVAVSALLQDAFAPVIAIPSDGTAATHKIDYRRGMLWVHQAQDADSLPRCRVRDVQRGL